MNVQKHQAAGKISANILADVMCVRSLGKELNKYKSVQKMTKIVKMDGISWHSTKWRYRGARYLLHLSLFYIRGHTPLPFAPSSQSNLIRD